MRATRAETTSNRRNPWPFLAFVALALMGIVALRPEPSAPVAASAPIGPVFTATPQPTTEPVMQCGVDGRPCIVVWATTSPQPTATDVPPPTPSPTFPACPVEPGKICQKATATPPPYPTVKPRFPPCSPADLAGAICTQPTLTPIPTRSAS